MTCASALESVGLFICNDGAFPSLVSMMASVSHGSRDSAALLACMVSWEMEVIVIVVFTAVAGCCQTFDVIGFYRCLCFYFFVTVEQLVTVYQGVTNVMR